MSPPYRRKEAGDESRSRPTLGLFNRSGTRRRPGDVVEPFDSSQLSNGGSAPYIPNNFSLTDWSPQYVAVSSSYEVPPVTGSAFDFGADWHPISNTRVLDNAWGQHYSRNERPKSHFDPCNLSPEHGSYFATDDLFGFDQLHSPRDRFGLPLTQDVCPTCWVCSKTDGRDRLITIDSSYKFMRCQRCELLLDGIRQLKDAPDASGSGMSELFRKATQLKLDANRRVGVPFNFSIRGLWSDHENPRFQCLTVPYADLSISFEPYKSLPDVAQQLDVEKVVSLVRKWMSGCDLFHTQCSSRNRNKLPKRVLSIPPDDKGTIKLVEDPTNTNAEYVALSYCWGPSGAQIQTTLMTLPLYREGIPVCHFPRLFLDVISICRALSIRYLWIDALCIIQDSTEDWELQASQMASIYSNSYLTIAATACADPSATLFSERWTESVLNNERIRMGVGVTSLQTNRGTVQIQPNLHLAHARFTKVDNAQEHMTDAPLLTRAWTYQERLLPAHTLHFHAEELVWECKSGVRCECGHLDDPALKDAEIHKKDVSFKPNPDRWLKSFVAQAAQPERTLEDLCDIWMDLISEYSGLSLTYEKDRLPALSGLAVNFSNKALGEYVAGMWTKALPALLLWKVCSDSEGPVRRHDDLFPSAPSWSWASVSLSPGIAVSYTRVINVAAAVLDKLEILNVHAETIGMNPYGWVQNAVLEVRGRTMECVAIEIGGGEIVLRRDDPELAADDELDPDHNIMELILDNRGIYIAYMKVMVLSIGSRFGIALEKASRDASGSHVFRRIGLVSWKEDRKTWSLRKDNQAKLKMRRLSII